jgi:hypothetical protein
VLWALVVVLVFSRHQFVFVTHEQKIPLLIAGLEDAWAFFGGVSRRLICYYVPGHIIDDLLPTELCGRGGLSLGSASGFWPAPAT